MALRAVALHVEVYERARLYCESRGVDLTTFVEARILAYLDEVPAARPAPPIATLPPATRAPCQCCGAPSGELDGWCDPCQPCEPTRKQFGRRCPRRAEARAKYDALGQDAPSQPKEIRKVSAPVPAAAPARFPTPPAPAAPPFKAHPNRPAVIGRYGAKPKETPPPPPMDGTDRAPGEPDLGAPSKVPAEPPRLPVRTEMF